MRGNAGIANEPFAGDVVGVPPALASGAGSGVDDVAVTMRTPAAETLPSRSRWISKVGPDSSTVPKPIAPVSGFKVNRVTFADSNASSDVSPSSIRTPPTDALTVMDPAGSTVALAFKFAANVAFPIRDSIPSCLRYGANASGFTPWPVTFRASCLLSANGVDEPLM